jgi:hypothetical protein
VARPPVASDTGVEDVDRVTTAVDRVELDVEVALQGVEVDSDVRRARLLGEILEAGVLSVVLGISPERFPLAKVRLVEGSPGGPSTLLRDRRFPDYPLPASR